MEEAITALLLADARLSQLVGNQVHWGRLPQGAKADAYVVLQVISGAPDYTMARRSGLEGNRVQIDGYAKTALAAKAVANAVTAVLEGFRGKRGGVRLQGGFIDTRRDWQPDSAAGNQLFRRQHDLMIWHSR